MAQSVRHVGYLVECEACHYRAVLETRDELTREVKALRRRARCSQCGSPGYVEVLWDAGWNTGFLERIREEVQRINLTRPQRSR